MGWAKSYIYAGSRLLSTITKSGSTEVTEYHHPDRLGTKLITNTASNTQKEQATLPFGTSIDAETSGTSGSGSSGAGAPSNKRFTSYDRSGTTGLDYAVNRTYNHGQSRFTQVDPIGMASASIGNPQSLNMFAYVTNDPVDFVDPSGTNLSARVICYTTPETYTWVNTSEGIPVANLTPGVTNCTVFAGSGAVSSGGTHGGEISVVGGEPTEVSSFIRQAVTFCVKELFHLDLFDFGQAAVGISNNGWAGLKDSRGNKFYVNHRLSFSAQDLGNIAAIIEKGEINSNQEPRIGFTGVGKLRANNTQTVEFDAYNTQGASDINNYPNQGNHQTLKQIAGLQLANQIHELGNALSIITGIDVGDKKNRHDTDSGFALGQCVERQLESTDPLPENGNA